MKTLYLVRHAEASWGTGDHQRPLSARGHAAAERSGRDLRARGAIPELIVASSATRARQTADHLAAGVGSARDSVIVDSRIYEAPLADLLAVVRGFDAAVARAMIVGHNPGISELAVALCQTAMPGFAPGTIVEMAFDVDDWKDAPDAVGQVVGRS